MWMTFEDANRDKIRLRVKVSTNRHMYACPYCGQWMLMGKGCANGHIAITPDTDTISTSKLL